MFCILPLVEVVVVKPICFVLRAWLAIVIVLGLLACQGSISQPAPSLSGEPTVTTPPAGTTTPTTPPHRIPSTFINPHTIPPQACLLADLPIINGTLSQLHRFAWSPTGDGLAYVGPAEPADSLTGPLMLVAAPRFDTPQPLASSAAGDPTWSPDGSQIAFVAFRSNDQLSTIITITVNGGPDLRDLLPGDMARTDPGTGYKAIDGWLDERLVVLTNCGTGCRRPWYLDFRKSTMEPIFPLSLQGISYAWSPDRTAVVVTSGANHQIGVISDMGREISWLSGHGAPDPAWTPFWTFFADWSPDSSRFLFLRQPDNASEPPELWVWNIRTGEGSPLLSGVIAARWSPRGDSIAFLTLGQPRLTPDGNWQGVVTTPQGPNPLGLGLYQYPEGKIITLFEIGKVDLDYNFLVESIQSFAPLWSPDGRQLVYYDGMGRAWILLVDELSQYELLTRRSSTDEAKWSPDGRKLAIATSGRLRIFAIPCSP